MVADPDSGPDLNPPTRLGQDVLGHWPSIPHSHLHEIVSKGLCSAKGLVILGNMNASYVTNFLERFGHDRPAKTHWDTCEIIFSVLNKLYEQLTLLT